MIDVFLRNWVSNNFNIVDANILPTPYMFFGWRRPDDGCFWESHGSWQRLPLYEILHYPVGKLGFLVCWRYDIATGSKTLWIWPWNMFSSTHSNDHLQMTYHPRPNSLGKYFSPIVDKIKFSSSSVNTIRSHSWSHSNRCWHHSNPNYLCLWFKC